MAEYAIQVDHLSKHYGLVKAVDDICFHVEPGEMVGFLGPNGAGKSTTMRILTTYLPATSGIARVCGFDVMNDSMKVRESIGYLPESVPLYPEMRVEEYLSYRAKLKEIDRSIRTRRIEESLEKCRVKEVRRRLLGTLSKGYRQRVGLADALLADPKVLILDEPTSGLDPLQIRETLNTIKSLAGSHTVLVSTHILSEVEAICDRIIIINRGTLRWDGKLSRLSEEAPKLVLEVKGPTDDIVSYLKGIQEVEQVAVTLEEGGFTTLEIMSHKGKDVREILAKRVIEKGWNLRRLDLKRKDLEALYMDTVLRQDGASLGV